MSDGAMTPAGSLRLRLPATSANLGPGFDAVAVALDFFLEIEASPAAEFSIAATGRDAERCGKLKDNLILAVYRSILEGQGRQVTPLSLQMKNAIPLGMGCGSSAAARVAGVVMAAHFGQLGWTPGQILDEACALEGHPDNVAACWLGGLVAVGCEGRTVRAARVEPPAAWRAIVVLPAEPVATSKARKVLPESYPLADVVANLQAVSMLGLAFAQGRADLLKLAMSDRIHQPYRAAISPQLPLLLPLVGQSGIVGAALSGAGPGVLVVVDCEESLPAASKAICKALEPLSQPELLLTQFLAAGASDLLEF